MLQFPADSVNKVNYCDVQQCNDLGRGEMGFVQSKSKGHKKSSHKDCTWMEAIAWMALGSVSRYKRLGEISTEILER